ncbi:Protein kinase domain-containing protein [Aphelenchoides bicaudatus]|nr:Protein kinase domain-containing protein [Aphelenchoides bicaudatus]
MPDNWDITMFGCQNFVVNATDYPCQIDSIYNEIIYDRSHYLSPFAYQRLTNFLVSKESTSSNTNLIFFVGKFDKDVFVPDNDDYCKQNVNSVNSSPKTTFIKLGLFNDTLLQKTFSNATVIDWDIEKNEVPSNWSQMLWKAFGCDGESPIVFPQTTSTVLPTTKVLTSTSKVSTAGLSSTTQVSTTKSSTSTLTTTTDCAKKKIAVFIPLLIIVVLGFIACFCLYRRKQHQQLVENIASNKYYRTNKACDEKREEDPWNISEDCLHINYFEKLGSGAFGDVFIARLIGDAPIKHIYADSPHCQRFHDIDVAVKALPSVNVDEYARSEFQKEIEFMKDLKFHVNLVCFLGYVSDPTNPLMILEYCANGDLLKFIKTNKQKFVESFESQEENTDCKTLISFAWQISSGLEYLSSLDLIHRDIAARNILLDAQNVCKVSDFGLCRLAEDLTYQSKGGKLPIRWMAIESLKDYVYSQKTDVWSYGVLLYELFTLGDLPYVHVENILAFIESGKRLEKPNYCSEEVYKLMLDCLVG